MFPRERLVAWGIAGLRILFIVVLAALALFLSDLFIRRAFAGLARKDPARFDDRRAKTLAGLLRSVVRYAVYFAAGTAVLSELAVDTVSILAGAGIVGLAIGFGAQNLVRDVIGGFFILLEGQFAVGDYITAAGVAGVVEEMGLRTTRLRDFGGELHIIPNGAIEKVTNHTRGSARVLVDVPVAYEADLARATAVLERVCAEFRQQSEVVVDGPRVLGVQELGDSGVILRVWARTVPMEQWAVERELRRRVKEAFDRERVEIPFRRQVVYLREEQPPETGKEAERN